MGTLINNILGSITEKKLANCDNGPFFYYYLNDPTTPALILQMGIWEVPPGSPRFEVSNWCKVTGPIGSYPGRCCQVYNTIAFTLTFVSQSGPVPITHWSSTPCLGVFPDAGEDFNAFYDRSSLRFFYGLDQIQGGVIYACNSSEVVSHELGHAILDSYRPDLWSTMCLEVFAFHESFGDIIAILQSLQHDEVCNYMLQETNGNLEMSNVVSRLAEQLGAAIFDQNPGGGFQRDALRNAFNQFVYVAPESLPTFAPDNQLTQEPHNFSRVFTGAFYDILAQIYAGQGGGLVALHTARDIMARLILHAVCQATVVPMFFASVAQQMIAVDYALHGGANVPIIAGVFAQRNIYRMPILFQMNPSPSEDHAFQFHAKVNDYLETPNPLGNLSVQLPKSLSHNFAANDESVINSADVALRFLHEKDLVSEDQTNMFTIINSAIVRNRSH